MKNWYSISNIDEIDSPALVFYPDRVKENIRILKTFVPEVARLRPHVKTNKCVEVCQLMMEAGISKFKCATIAEAEMLAANGAKDVLLAYQPTGPKIQRLAQLMLQFPNTQFSCLVDNEQVATQLSGEASKNKMVLRAWIDLNIGMNRTGISPAAAFKLFEFCQTLHSINIMGLHAYDGHLRDADLDVRTRHCNDGFRAVEDLAEKIKTSFNKTLPIVAGGTPTFPIHAKRTNVECSPGTFVFWDKGYADLLKEQPFLFAALAISRVVSKPAENILCLDLGHKAIASENPLANRVAFLNAPELEAIGHSEEHLMVKTNRWSDYTVGDVLYGVPVHICPTVALYELAWVVEEGTAKSTWRIEARRRKINI
jgi:D-threonine aldolase